MILRPSRWKLSGLLGVCLILGGGGVAGITEGEFWMGWTVTLLFALGALVFAVQILFNASYLELLPEGFVVCSLFRRHPPIAWEMVSEFMVGSVAGRKMVVFDRVNARTKNQRIAAINVGLVGATDGLPDTYGLRADELALLMNHWREQALRYDAP